MTMLAPGTTVQDRYRVDHLIGQGGFGAVYEAVDERLGRRVALKQLLRISERISRQFEREARLLANLDHPSLPSVIDHFSTPDGQFLVMQYVRGTDLADQLAQRSAPYPPAQVLAWGDQVLDVLQYLHGLQPQIVHRDIKPQNIKLKADGSIMLLDFGLAKGFAGESPPSTTESSLLAYTKGYAPPEQIEGTGTDERSDLYALAATLHCLVTNVLPVEAAMRLLADARGRADPLRPAHEINPDVPEPISRVLQQALSLEPDGRPASAQEMRAMLRAAASDAMLAPLPLPDTNPVPPTVRLGGLAADSTQQPFSRQTAPPTEERPPSRPPQPATSGLTIQPDQPATAGQTMQPPEQATTGQPPRAAAPAATQGRAADTFEHATVEPTHVPPAPPPLPPAPAQKGRRLPRPACLAIVLGSALLALCLGGAAVASAMGWFRNDAIVLLPSPAALTAVPSAGPSATAAPASPSAQPSAAAAPTATAAPSFSAAPSNRPDALVSSTRLNLRAGPGEVYAIIASYGEGTPLRIQGKQQGSNWLYVQTPDGNNGWMLGDFLLVNIQLQNVAVVQAPPTPPPAPTARPTPTPTPAPWTATPTPKVSPTPAAGAEDSARIIAIWPAPGTTLSAGQPQEFQIKLQYSLVSADKAIAMLFMEQFPAGAGGCKGAEHRTNGGTQFAIERGQGTATVEVVWNGAQGSGYVSPGVNFWSDGGGKAVQPLIRGFGVFAEPCYAFG